MKLTFADAEPVEVDEKLCMVRSGLVRSALESEAPEILVPHARSAVMRLVEYWKGSDPNRTASVRPINEVEHARAICELDAAEASLEDLVETTRAAAFLDADDATMDAVFTATAGLVVDVDAPAPIRGPEVKIPRVALPKLPTIQIAPWRTRRDEMCAALEQKNWFKVQEMASQRIGVAEWWEIVDIHLTPLPTLRALDAAVAFPVEHRQFVEKCMEKIKSKTTRRWILGKYRKELERRFDDDMSGPCDVAAFQRMSGETNNWSHHETHRFDQIVRMKLGTLMEMDAQLPMHKSTARTVFERLCADFRPISAEIAVWLSTVSDTIKNPSLYNDGLIVGHPETAKVVLALCPRYKISPRRKLTTKTKFEIYRAVVQAGGMDPNELLDVNRAWDMTVGLEGYEWSAFGKRLVEFAVSLGADVNTTKGFDADCALERATMEFCHRQGGHSRLRGFFSELAQRTDKEPTNGSFETEPCLTIADRAYLRQKRFKRQMDAAAVPPDCAPVLEKYLPPMETRKRGKWMA